MLAENHVRSAKIGNTENDQFPFFTSMIAVVKDVLSDTKYGKKYEHLIELSEKYPNEKFYKLISISTTRFAGYFHDVLYAILADIKIIMESLRERSENDDDKDAKLLLKRISNIRFLALLSGMVDIYSTLGKLCGILQKVNLFIWERKQMVEKYLDNMGLMINELHSDTATRTKWCTLNKYWPLLEKKQIGEEIVALEEEEH